jgi:plastocyanin
MKAKIALLTILLAGLSAYPSRAAQVTTTTYSTSGFTVDTSQDLILSVLPSVSGNTGSTSISGLTDGLAPNSIPGYDGNNTLNNGVTLTYDLGAEATINEIQTYTAWPGDRFLQDYTVDFSLDGTTWTNGVIAVVNQGTDTLGGWNNVKVAVTTDDSSPLATNARYVRFNFNNQQNGAVGYTEIVVNGASFGLPETPAFTEIPQSQTVTNGDSVTFTAQATGFPAPIITWHFIDSSSVDHLLSTVGNTLTFPSQLADAGQYYAVASNTAGTVNSTPAAVLTVNPTIVTNRNFAANAAAFTEGASYFGGGNPEAAPGWTGGSGINGTLTPAPDYFGPANAGGLTYLFMQGAKTVTQQITTTVGTRYLFSFKAACRQGNVVGLTVWADNTQTPNLTIPDGGLSGSSFQDYSFIFTGSGTQTIQFVNSGSGDFTADVTDVSVTEDTGSPEAPVFTEIPQSQTVTGGDNVTFTAQATGYPTPIITWHFIDSSSVDHTLSTVGNTLTFTAKSVDAGEYYAVASNSVATVPSTPAAILTVNPGLVDETDLSLSGGSFAALDANDLILGNAGSSALTITTDGDGVGSASLLTDGNLGAPQTGGPLGITGGVITYDLGSGANGIGYDITGIRSLSAWADGGRFKPKYTVSYSVDGLNFIPLWTVDYSTATGNGADVSLAINSLQNVRYVKFNFSGGQQNGWVSYRELAVFGTSSASADPFAAWINGLDWSAFTSPDLTPTGDPDGDGMSNQQEFAFGLDPRSGTSVNPITQQLNKATGTFKYTRTKASGLSYVYQYSTTLSEPWDTFASETPLPDSVSISDTVEEVTVTVPAALLNANTKLFVRVQAQ